MCDLYEQYYRSLTVFCQGEAMSRGQTEPQSCVVPILEESGYCQQAKFDGGKERFLWGLQKKGNDGED